MIINGSTLNLSGMSQPFQSQQIQKNQANDQRESITLGGDNRINGRDRRFDIFINEAGENFMGNIAARIEGALFDVMCMSAEDRRHLAFMNKENMKRLTNEAIDHEKEELEKFLGLKEQKAYYQGVLDDNCFVEKGKFGLSGLSKVKVSESDVRALLDGVQSKIDDIVTAKVAKENDPFDTKTFEYLYSGAMFLAAADMRGNEAAVVKDSSISGQWTRTEENFVEESQKTVESLEKRLEDIEKMHKALVNDGGFEKRVSEETLNEKHDKAAALMDIFTAWSKKAFYKLMMSESEDAQRENEKKLKDGINDILTK